MSKSLIISEILDVGFIKEITRLHEVQLSEILSYEDCSLKYSTHRDALLSYLVVIDFIEIINS